MTGPEPRPRDGPGRPGGGAAVDSGRCPSRTEANPPFPRAPPRGRRRGRPRTVREPRRTVARPEGFLSNGPQRREAFPSPPRRLKSPSAPAGAGQGSRAWALSRPDPAPPRRRPVPARTRNSATVGAPDQSRGPERGTGTQGLAESPAAGPFTASRRDTGRDTGRRR